jgi:hypothetical protein
MKQIFAIFGTNPPLLALPENTFREAFRRKQEYYYSSKGEYAFHEELFKKVKRAYFTNEFKAAFLLHLESLIVRLPKGGYILKNIHRPINNDVHPDAQFFFFTARKVIGQAYNLTEEKDIQEKFRSFYSDYLEVHHGTIILNLTWGKGFSKTPYRPAKKEKEPEKSYTDV